MALSLPSTLSARRGGWARASSRRTAARASSGEAQLRPHSDQTDGSEIFSPAQHVLHLCYTVRAAQPPAAPRARLSVRERKRRLWKRASVDCEACDKENR